jgi:hypothetical protein
LITDAFSQAGLRHPAIPEFASLLGIPSAEARAELTTLNQSVARHYDTDKYSDAKRRLGCCGTCWFNARNKGEAG